MTIEQIFNFVADYQQVGKNEASNRKTHRALYVRNITYWIACRMYEYSHTDLSEYFNFRSDIQIRSGIKEVDLLFHLQEEKTLTILYKFLCNNKEENTTSEKTDGTCSLLALYDTLCKCLPLAQLNMSLIHGRTYLTDTIDTKRLYSDTLRLTIEERFLMANHISPTSHMSHGTHSFYFTSDKEWALRETLKYDFATEDEKQHLYAALVEASAWGRKCDFEDFKRKEQLRNSPNEVYISMID